MDFPTLSYSKFNTYIECPRKWEFTYIQHLPEEERSYFTFGRTIHSALEAYVRPLLPPTDQKPADLEDLLDLYNIKWKREGYATQEEEYRYYALGQSILTEFHKDFAAPPEKHPLMVEKDLYAATPAGFGLHGIIDRVDLMEDNRLHVLDYKTSQKMIQADAETSDQLSIYQLLVEGNFKLVPGKLTLFHLRSMQQYSVEPRSKSAVEGLISRMARVVDDIKSEKFPPTPSWKCRNCPYRTVCPEARF
jgi:RecB family exonuclease